MSAHPWRAAEGTGLALGDQVTNLCPEAPWSCPAWVAKPEHTRLAGEWWHKLPLSWVYRHSRFKYIHFSRVMTSDMTKDKGPSMPPPSGRPASAISHPGESGENWGSWAKAAEIPLTSCGQERFYRKDSNQEYICWNQWEGTTDSVSLPEASMLEGQLHAVCLAQTSAWIMFPKCVRHQTWGRQHHFRSKRILHSTRQVPLATHYGW